MGMNKNLFSTPAPTNGAAPAPKPGAQMSYREKLAWFDENYGKVETTLKALSDARAEVEELEETVEVLEAKCSAATDQGRDVIVNYRTALTAAYGALATLAKVRGDAVDDTVRALYERAMNGDAA